MLKKAPFAKGIQSIPPLSEKSIENDGEPQDIPDFTKGSWKSRKPVFGISSEF